MPLTALTGKPPQHLQQGVWTVIGQNNKSCFQFSISSHIYALTPQHEPKLGQATTSHLGAQYEQDHSELTIQQDQPQNTSVPKRSIPMSNGTKSLGLAHYQLDYKVSQQAHSA